MTTSRRQTLGIHRESISLARTTVGTLCATIAAGAVALEHGFVQEIAPAPFLIVSQLLFAWLALYLADELRIAKATHARWRTGTGLVGELLIALSLSIELLGYELAAEIGAVAVFVMLVCRLNSQLSRNMRRPALLFPGSFIALIAITAVLLKLPASTPQNQPISWLDASFTATSAVCVTGLAVRNTADGFTTFGHVVIAAAIQLGALGVMIFGSTLAMLFGSKLSMRENATLSSALDEYPANKISRFAWFIVLSTLTLEAIAATALYYAWPANDLPNSTRAGNALFHAISAFCNAGFDLTGDSLVPYRHSLGAFAVIAPLIVLGGIGFIVLEDVALTVRDRFDRSRRTRRRLALHTRVVLITTALLVLAGWAVIFTAQHNFTFHGMLDALFMSVTGRTAGFTTLPMDELAPGSRFMLMSLMIIGGSPGGTAGGLKTVVFAVLVLAVISTIRGRNEVEVFKRSIHDSLVKRAATIAFGIATLISVAMLALDLSESGIRFELLFFEVISAATTTGLSLGGTEHISLIGRGILIATMFFGRVGPLVVAASLVTGASAAYSYPRENVTLG